MPSMLAPQPTLFLYSQRLFGLSCVVPLPKRKEGELT